MRSSLKSVVAASLCVATTNAAHAANIIYTVNNFVGAVGHLTGTVETDGTIGVLSAANFIHWNFNVLGNGASDTLTDGNSGVFSGGGSTTATATGIFFDFSNPAPSFLLFQKVFSSGNNYVCAASTVFPSTPCLQGASLVPENFANASAQYSTPTGNVLVATVAGVPEPAAWALMIAGFGLVGAAARRRQSVRVTYA